MIARSSGAGRRPRSDATRTREADRGARSAGDPTRGAGAWMEPWGVSGFQQAISGALLQGVPRRWNQRVGLLCVRGLNVGHLPGLAALPAAASS